MKPYKYLTLILFLALTIAATGCMKKPAASVNQADPVLRPAIPLTLEQHAEMAQAEVEHEIEDVIEDSLENIGEQAQ